MRWINRNLRHFGGIVEARSDPARRSLLSEAAFFSLFQPLDSAEVGARRFITTLPRGGAAAARISNEESAEIAALRAHLLSYLGTETTIGEPKYLPEFAGCGVVEAARGDILIADELIEVKAVQRSFRSLDIRQVLTYAALAYSAGIVLGRITLLNPRWATFYSSEVDELAMDIGSGSWVELMKDLIESMSGFEVSL